MARARDEGPTEGRAEVQSRTGFNVVARDLGSKGPVGRPELTARSGLTNRVWWAEGTMASAGSAQRHTPSTKPIIAPVRIGPPPYRNSLRLIDFSSLIALGNCG